MPTTNQNAKVIQLENTQYVHEDINNYKYNHDLLLEYKINVVSTHRVTWNDLNIQSRKGQVRAKDIDPSLLDKMKISIEKIGLQSWPIGMYEEDSQKITVLSGHHRLHALLDVETPDPLNDAIFPIMLVKSKSKLSLRKWMQRENGHEDSVSKGNSKDDAVKYIQDIYSDFPYLFKNLNQNEIKDKVYQLLNESFPFLKTTAIKAVYDQAMKGKKKEQIKSLQKVDQDALQLKLWKKTCGAGKIIGKKCYISSAYDPSRKSIMMQCVDRAEAFDDDPDNTPQMDIQLIIWFPSTVRNLQERRQTALDVYAKMNLHVIDPKLAIINKVTFPEQDVSKCLNDVHSYSWDAKKKKFV